MGSMYGRIARFTLEGNTWVYTEEGHAESTPEGNTEVHTRKGHESMALSSTLSSPCTVVCSLSSAFESRGEVLRACAGILGVRVGWWSPVLFRVPICTERHMHHTHMHTQIQTHVNTGTSTRLGVW